MGSAPGSVGIMSLSKRDSSSLYRRPSSFSIDREVSLTCGLFVVSKDSTPQKFEHALAAADPQ